MAIQIRRGTDAQWEALKGNIVVGELATTTDTERAFLGTGSGTYFEMANIELIADEFDSSVSYAEGDVCIYQGKLYQFTANHSGAWSGTDVEQVTASEVGSGGTAISDLQDNALIHRTASGSIASFSDGSDMPMDSLIVDINPVQNLNGYDRPWSGGGGNNKLPNALAGTYSNNGVTMVSNGDGSYTLSGATTTSSANVYFDFVDEYEIASGDYFYIWNSVANANATCNLEKAGGGNITYYGIAPINRKAQIADTYVGQSIGRIRVYVAANTTISMTIKPMIAKSNSLTVFEPYENICPISGWDSVDVNVVGKNWLEPISKSGKSTGYYLEFSKNSNVYHINEIHLREGVQYRFRIKASSTVSEWFVSAGAGSGLYLKDISMTNKSYVDGIYTVYFIPTATDLSMGDIFAFRAPRYSSIQTYTYAIEWAELSIASQNTDSEYSPYNGNTTTVSLGQTVYGGSLNVTSGVLTIDRAMAVLDGSEDEVWYDYPSYNGYLTEALTQLMAIGTRQDGVCNMLKDSKTTASGQTGAFWLGVNNKRFYAIGVKDSMGATVEEFRSFLSNEPLQIVFPLATQTTVQLTPTQVNTLLGQNNVWADSGDVEVTYTANASLTIEEIINAITALGGNV